MITKFRVQNYKALRDVELALTPIHVLIGPNDTGKTSILEAIAALCRSADYPLTEAFTGSWSGADLVWRGDEQLCVSLTAELGEARYQVQCLFDIADRDPIICAERLIRPSLGRDTQEIIELCAESGGVSTKVYKVAHKMGESSKAAVFGDGWGSPHDVHEALSGVHFYHWNPDLLSLPVVLDAQRGFRMDKSGFGLAQCLDDILGADRERFTQLETRFRRIFPGIRSIKLLAEPAYKAAVDEARPIPVQSGADGKGVHFQMTEGGHIVRASLASDGMLLVLAYLAVLHLPEPPRVLLIEEPENGVHPKRLAEVLQILRELVAEQSHTQVILTTHSPYVVDLFKPEEVTLCTKREDGSIAVRRLSESQTVRDQIKVFTLGEIWTAEGDETLSKPDTPAPGADA